MNFRLTRLSIHVKNVRAKILEKECIPSKTIEERKGQCLPRACCVLVLLWVSSPHALRQVYLFFFMSISEMGKWRH